MLILQVAPYRLPTKLEFGRGFNPEAEINATMSSPSVPAGIPPIVSMQPTLSGGPSAPAMGQAQQSSAPIAGLPPQLAAIVGGMRSPESYQPEIDQNQASIASLADQISKGTPMPLEQRIAVGLATILPALFSKGASAKAGLDFVQQDEKNWLEQDKLNREMGLSKYKLSMDERQYLLGQQAQAARDITGAQIKGFETNEENARLDKQIRANAALEGSRAAHAANQKLDEATAMFGGDRDRAREFLLSEAETEQKYKGAQANKLTAEADLINKTADAKKRYEEARAARAEWEPKFKEAAESAKDQRERDKIELMRGRQKQYDRLVDIKEQELIIARNNGDSLAASRAAQTLESLERKRKLEIENSTLPESLKANLLKTQAETAFTQTKDFSEKAMLPEKVAESKAKVDQMEATTARLTTMTPALLAQTQASTDWLRKRIELEPEKVHEIARHNAVMEEIQKTQQANKMPSPSVREQILKDTGIEVNSPADLSYAVQKYRNDEITDRVIMTTAAQLSGKEYVEGQKRLSPSPGFEFRKGGKLPTESEVSKFQEGVSGAIMADSYLAKFKDLVKKNGGAIALPTSREGAEMQKMLQMAHSSMLTAFMRGSPLAKGNPSRFEVERELMKIPEFNTFKAFMLGEGGTLDSIDAASRYMREQIIAGGKSANIQYVGVPAKNPVTGAAMRRFPSVFDVYQTTSGGPQSVRDILGESMASWNNKLSQGRR